MKILLFAISAALLWVATAGAADIELLDVPSLAVKMVSFRGEIVDGDAKKFRGVVDGLDRVSVFLESPGGLVKEALEIGAEIRVRNFATVAGQECFSACGLIWLSGARRYMSSTSKVGFHAAYREENGEYKESGVANAEIGSFLTHLGLRVEAIRFFTIAGPDQFLLLTPAKARILGIEVYEDTGTGLTTPNQAPTADMYAARFMAYGILRSQCEALFKLNQSFLENATKKNVEEGTRLVGSDKWIDLWMASLEQAKTEVRDKGSLLVCLQTEAWLREQGQPTGIDGPSFTCSKAGTETEKALCSDENLWARDRAMSAIFFYIRGVDNPKMRKAMLADQREWLRKRNACGSDTNCLDVVYGDRLRAFRDVDVRR
ncbi:hypothetical protein NKI74_33160 [Mesorhizobium sp. M0494]|uniref:hypothetical protein n=1 Tax=Mesorhizobium sp. M0494 TaxID=2956951 RepID=UPI00333CACB1